MRKTILLLASMVLAVLLASGVALAAAGSLDLSFGGGDGKVFTDPNDTEIRVNAYAEDIIVQPNGKLVAAGTVEFSTSVFALVRYKPDGTRDKRFSGDGKVLTRWRDQAGYTETARAYAVATQPDRKLIAGGYVGLDFGLARYNPDGSIDKSFGGGDGRVTTNFGSDTNHLGGPDPHDSDTLRALIIQPDGKLVAVGTSDDLDCSSETGVYSCTRNAHFALARYNSDGTRDKSFGDNGNGKILTDVGGPGLDMGSDVVLQPDGKLVVSGTTYSSEDNSRGVALVRYNLDGSLDTSFDADGKVTSDAAFLGGDAALALRPDGGFVAAGMTHKTTDHYSPGNFILAAFEPDGSPDAGFGGGDGVVETRITRGEDAALDLVVQADGKPVAAGYADPTPITTDSKRNFALTRYNPDGSLDDTFDGDGKVRTNMKGIDEARALALQPDGRLVAAGAAYKIVDAGGDTHAQTDLGTFAVARYEGQ